MIYGKVCTKKIPCHWKHNKIILLHIYGKVYAYGWTPKRHVLHRVWTMCSQSSNQSKIQLLGFLSRPIVKKKARWMSTVVTVYYVKCYQTSTYDHGNSKHVYNKYVGAPMWTLGQLLKGMVFIKLQSHMLEWPCKSPQYVNCILALSTKMSQLGHYETLCILGM